MNKYSYKVKNKSSEENTDDIAISKDILYHLPIYISDTQTHIYCKHAEQKIWLEIDFFAFSC